MRLKPEESKKLTTTLTDRILKDKAVTVKVPRQKLLDAIERELVKHFEEERQIEQESERLYVEQHPQATPHDKAKAVTMIRKQLAKEKDFLLSGAPDGRFSQDKISHIAHLVGDRIYDDDLADFIDEDEGPKYIKRFLIDYFGKENEIGEKVRKKIQSLANAPFEGSRDWDVLYRKYFEEEMRRVNHS